jgi:hypothetical protein
VQEWDHNLRLPTELVAETLDDLDRPAEALKFGAMLRDERADSYTLPFRDELIVGAREDESRARDP